MNKTIITASSMTKWLTCQRAYFYRYICGFVKVRESDALRFGTAWHKAMESRARGKDFNDCYADAITGTDIDPHVAGMLYGMLQAYWEKYAVEHCDMQPEQEFVIPIKGNYKFAMAGKMDCIGKDIDQLLVLTEHKTTSESVEPGSQYWERLRFNIQMLTYVWACSILVVTPKSVVYDVVKKTAIRPKEVPNLDENGLKIILAADGTRAMKKDGTPYLSAGTGMTALTHMETPEEYATRVYEDIKARPDYYLARNSMCILDGDIAAYVAMRRTVIRQISAAERMSKAYGAEAYPRNCNAVNCRGCDYAMFCMSNTIADTACLPEGFELKKAHVELNSVQEQE